MGLFGTPAERRAIRVVTLLSVVLGVLVVTAGPVVADCTTQATAGFARLQLVGAGCITTNGAHQTTPSGVVVLVNGLEFHPATGVSLTLDSAAGTLSSGGGNVTIDVGLTSQGKTQVALAPHPISWRVKANPGETQIDEGSF